MDRRWYYSLIISLEYIQTYIYIYSKDLEIMDNFSIKNTNLLNAKIYKEGHWRYKFIFSLYNIFIFLIANIYKLWRDGH